MIDYLKHLYPNQYFKLVHRLDQGTSGCLLIAKNRAALLYLQQQFKDRTISKSYKALCVGQLKQSPVNQNTLG